MKSIAMFLLVLLLVAGGSCSASAQEAKNRQDVLAELAAVELRVTVDRDFSGADTALTALEAQCANTGLADVLTDPVVEATRVRIRTSLEAARRDDGVDLEKSVLDALRNNDEITLTTLGSRAAAVMRDALGNDSGLSRQVDVDRVLDWMIRLDPDAALAWFRADPMRLEPERASVALDRIVARLPWAVHEGRTPVLQRPEWLDVIAGMIENPAVASTLSDRRKSLGTLKNLVSTLSIHDAFTPRLAEDVMNLMSSMDGYAVLEVMTSFGQAWAKSGQPIFEHFVVDERVAVRTSAARILVAADASPGLRSRVHDPDSGVRLLVLDSLGPRDRRTALWRERRDQPSWGTVNLPAPDDAEARALMVTLAADPEPVVRERCVNVLSQLPTPVEAAAYRALAADSDPLVRVAMCQLIHPDARLQTELLVALARDADLQVVRGVELRLARDDNRGKWKTNVDAWMPVLIARLDNAKVPLDQPHFLAGAMSSPAARRACTQLVLERNDPAVLKIIAMYAGLNVNGDVTNDDAAREWTLLPGPDLSRLLPLLQTVSEKLPVAVAYTAPGRELDASVPAAVEPLARDTDRPLGFRLAALGLALHEPTPERLELLKQLLSDPSFAPGTNDSIDDNRSVIGAVGGTPEEQRNGVIHDVVTRIPLRQSLRYQILGQYRLSAPEADGIVKLLLGEWLDYGDAWDLVEKALAHVGQTPALADEDTLRRAARSVHMSTAVGTLARLRDPRFLPILTECLDPTWISLDSTPGRDEYACLAVDALQGYMSDEAANILLNAAANSSYAKVREKALLAVEAIGRYRDALAAWQRRTAVATSRDSTIGELASIAADSSAGPGARAAALRGLGTLQAVDMMPLIIRALTDPDSSVRQAAETALDQLNAPAPVGPPPAATKAEPKKP